MGQMLILNEVVEIKLVSFFESKPSKFYEEGIGKHIGRWEDVISKNESYVKD